jgi:excisionase family DNA binding protein
MARPQAPLHPIRPSKAEAQDISALRAILQHWFFTMPEVARLEAATAGQTSRNRAAPEEGHAEQISAEEAPPTIWSAFTIISPDGTRLDLPPSIARGLFVMLSALSEGDAVVVVPMGTDLTTQEAANLLGVSRPYLIRLINQGRIPCEWVGSHRRIRVEDVLAYRRSSQAKQRGALRQLADETDSANLRYSEDE